MHFLCDLLSTLGQLNKIFQIPTFHPSAVHGKVNEALQNRYLQDTLPFAKKCMEQTENGEMVVDQGRVGRAATDAKELTSDNASKLVQAVVDNMLARFPSNDLIEAFDPTSDAIRATYGERELAMLTKHYSNYFDASLCSLE